METLINFHANSQMAVKYMTHSAWAPWYWLKTYSFYSWNQFKVFKKHQLQVTMPELQIHKIPYLLGALFVKSMWKSTVYHMH